MLDSGVYNHKKKDQKSIWSSVSVNLVELYVDIAGYQDKDDLRRMELNVEKKSIPLKVFNTNRQIRKGIVCHSFSDLLAKCK